MWDKIILLLFPGNLNVADENGDTLLHIAVYERSVEAIKYLLNNNANTQLLNKKGYPPIHYVGTDLAMRSLLEKK